MLVAVLGSGLAPVGALPAHVLPAAWSGEAAQAGPADRGTVQYRPPVDAPVADPFRPPIDRYGPGNRGIEYRTTPGTVVRAIGPGVVTFSGPVAGQGYVTIAHPDGLRSSYGALARRTVRVGERVPAGAIVGRTAGRLHLGVRSGSQYLDPASLWAIVVPAGRAYLVPLDGGPDPPPPAAGAPGGPVPTGGPVRVCPFAGVPTNCLLVPRLTAMVAAAAADGVRLRLGNSYRDVALQIQLRRAHCGSSPYAIYEMPSSQCHPPTARPGRSNHQRGLAIDFAACGSRRTACYRWLAGHASRFGLFNLPSEAWHWSVDGR